MSKTHLVLISIVVEFMIYVIKFNWLVVLVAISCKQFANIIVRQTFRCKQITVSCGRHESRNFHHVCSSRCLNSKMVFDLMLLVLLCFLLVLYKVKLLFTNWILHYYCFLPYPLLVNQLRSDVDFETLPLIVFLWRWGPTRAMASSVLGFLHHTQRRTTFGRTTLDEWSARRRELYLTTHSNYNRQTSMSPVGFEPTVSTGERSQSYDLDRAATGTGGNRIYALGLSSVAFTELL